MSDKPKSKTQIILDHLQGGGTLTIYDAFDLYREAKLSNKLSTLRKKGHKIIGVKTKPWKLGEPIVARRYYIDEYVSLEQRARYNLPHGEKADE